MECSFNKNAIVRAIVMTINKWRLKTPNQKWQTIYHIGGVLGDSIGTRVFTTVEVDWYTYMLDVFAFLFLVSSPHTVWFYFEKREYLRGLQGTCAIGIFAFVSY